MAFFNRASPDNPFLYIAEQLPQDVGWCAYVLPEDSPFSGSEIGLAQSFDSLDGTYLFSSQPVVAPANAIVEKVHQHLAKISPNRGLMWVTAASQETVTELLVLGFKRGEKPTISNELKGPLSDNLFLRLPNSCTVRLEDSIPSLRITSTADSELISFYTNVSPPSKAEVDPNQVHLFFSGPGRGCLGFSLFIYQATDFTAFDFALKYVIADPAGQITGQKYPLLRPDHRSATVRVGFSSWIDFTSPENSKSLRTFFAFTGKNYDETETVLPATFQTDFGHPIDLTPRARLSAIQDLPQPGSALMVLQPNWLQGQNRYLAPSGDFELRTNQSKAPTGSSAQRLLCGLEGTESITFNANDCLRFTPNSPAFVTRFPFSQVSPVGPPFNPEAPKLLSQFLTSWTTIVKSGSNLEPLYLAQPKGSALYGREDGLINGPYPALLGHKDPAFPLPKDPEKSFPLVPYAGLVVANNETGFSQEQIETFERQVLAPTRRVAIGVDPSRRPVASARQTANGLVTDTEQRMITPSGLLATLTTRDGSTTWSSILLGQIKKGGLTQPFSFNYPDPDLVQAFQTSQLFLVAANSYHLEAQLPDSSASFEAGVADSPSFANRLEIGGWELVAAVGQNNRYGDYRDVFLFKGCKGSLYNPPPIGKNGEKPPDTISLVANPDKWTQADAFASPTTRLEPQTLQPPDPSQQIILSQWLQDYFRDVRARASDTTQAAYYRKLDQIAADPNWTGILVLKMTIANTPPDLVGILAGVTDPASFNAHHLGIELSQIDNSTSTLTIKDSSSIFGLISYDDPNYDPARPSEPIAPAQGVDYDFRLLTLRVLFANTAVEEFKSYAQVTLNKLLHMPVTGMGEKGNSFNTIILTGSYQDANGQAIYSLRSLTDNSFYFDNNVLNKIEIVEAQLSTRDAGAQGNVISWFGLSGFFDFKEIHARSKNGTGNPGPPFDVFSFGNPDGQDSSRQGLSFSNLGLQLTFPKTTPEKRVFTPSIAEIRFDPTVSTPRDKSIYINFALELQGIQTGSSDSPPSDAGILPVITDARLTGVDDGPWYALRYQLNLGSPGALAGKIGLTSSLFTAWSPTSSGDTSYDALVGIQLPGTGGGAKLISLQTVLKLSIGQIRLTRDQAKDSFLLMLTEIALKFLGILSIPPGASTLFYLFGNPKNQGKASGLGWYALYRKK